MLQVCYPYGKLDAGMIDAVSLMPSPCADCMLVPQGLGMRLDAVTAVLVPRPAYLTLDIFFVRWRRTSNRSLVDRRETVLCAKS